MKRYYTAMLILSLTCGGCADDESCTKSTWYADTDGDSLGDAQTSLSACEQPEGYVPDDTDDDDTSAAFTLFSDAISDGVLLDEYKCEEKVADVENSIPLSWVGVPENTGSLAIVMYHYPSGSPEPDKAPNTYLYLWDIDPSVSEIAYGKADEGNWYMGPNKDGTAISYTSPCSHSEGTHTYYITIFALYATPESFPIESTLDMDWFTFKEGIASVPLLGSSTLMFDDVN